MEKCQKAEGEAEGGHMALQEKPAYMLSELQGQKANWHRHSSTFGSGREEQKNKNKINKMQEAK